MPTSTPVQQTPEPFPTILVVASAVTLTFVASALFFYFRKRKP
jgi:hypothetical protein